MLDFTLDIEQMRTGFAVYEHSHDGAVIYVGTCRVRELMAPPDAYRNSEWKKLTLQIPSIRTRVLRVVYSGQAAEEYAAVVLAGYRVQPHCNTVEKVKAQRRGIICTNDEGREFPTIAEAARFYGVAATSISNHLAGRTGYPHVSGFKFERV